MTKTRTPHYKIVPGSAGSFLAPPGHLSHHYTLEGYESTRHRNPISIGGIEGALADDFDGSDAIKRRVREILDKADIHPSELWLRSVYAHFRNCYVPESGSRNASDLIIHSVTEIAQKRALNALQTLGEQVRERARTRASAAEAGAELPAGDNPENFRRGVTPLYGRRRGYEVTAAPDGTKVYVYALADDGTRYSADHLTRYTEALDASDDFTSVMVAAHPEDGILDRVVATLTDPPQPMDPERHAAVACVRKYFPDHEPRLDLIANPKATAGLCEKCGEKVQYEGKLDKLAIVTTRMDGRGMTHWSYNTECAEGGDHVR